MKSKNNIRCPKVCGKLVSKRAVEIGLKRVEKRESLYWIRVMARKAGFIPIKGFDYRLTKNSSINKTSYNRSKKSKISSKTSSFSSESSQEILPKVVNISKGDQKVEDQTYVRKPIKMVFKKNKTSDVERNAFIKRSPIEPNLKITEVIDGKVMDRILCVFYNSGKLCHLIKWKGSNKCQVCHSHVVNRKWPQVVIKFYETKLRFKS